jgi:ABC-2 type transport system ATP-binding protein
VRARSPQADRLRELLSAESIPIEMTEDGGLAIGETTAAHVGEVAAANGVVLHELVGETATLEETFLELTGGESTS